MKKRLITTLLLASVMTWITGCGTGGGGGTDIGNGSGDGGDQYKTITAANNELGFQMLREVNPDKNGNLFISPASLLMALSMVYNGAEGTSKAEIAKVLQNEGIAVEELNQANASLMAKLQQDSSQIQLDIGNSIWINDQYHFQDDFAKNTQQYFQAEIQEMDITAADSVQRINNWVKKATNDKIQSIVDAPLNPDLVSLLINAIYFKGSWTYPFEKGGTEAQPFHLPDGSEKEVPLMTLNEDLPYLENEDFQAAVLPYGIEKNMSMYVFLPKEGHNLEEFTAELSVENWQQWKTAFHEKTGTVMLPKFKLEYESQLNDTLKKLGMNEAFDTENANFSKMVQEYDPIWISAVKQKTFLEVNEEGTEAAAVTSVEMETTSARIDEPFRMEVNRPFFITIIDEETDTILFMGTIANP
ncbi:serpin family protein [Bacillaceae bacterium Marseille-Q3522]|nr:serpin family protein [Bacillaceae bacterium Marseille-Q3522]